MSPIPRLHIVLVEPEIPPNTGTIARFCAATHTVLHLIEPLGFKLDDRALKRAGMDYWKHVTWHTWPNWAALCAAYPKARFYFLTTKAARPYTEARFEPGDFLVFGRETAGLPAEIIAQYPGGWLRIPMFDTNVRSLNLSNCVALVLYEALRQQGFAGEI